MQSNPFEAPTESLRETLARLLRDGGSGESPGKVQTRSFTTPGAPPPPMQQQQPEITVPQTPISTAQYSWTQGLADMMKAYNKGMARNNAGAGYGFGAGPSVGVDLDS